MNVLKNGIQHKSVNITGLRASITFSPLPNSPPSTFLLSPDFSCGPNKTPSCGHSLVWECLLRRLMARGIELFVDQMLQKNEIKGVHIYDQFVSKEGL